MGGIAILGATVAGYIVGNLRPGGNGFEKTGLTLMLLIVGMGVVGFIDDYLGIRFDRNLGLNKRAKSAGQLLVAIVFTLLSVHWVHVSTKLSFARDLGPDLGGWVWGIWAVLVGVFESGCSGRTCRAL